MPSSMNPPFVWTPRQKINPAGHLAALQGGGKRSEETNRWFLFRRLVEVADNVTDGALSITVDGRYELFVNGAFVGRGPVRCSPLYQRYDTWNVGEYFKPGKNTIAVLIHTYGVDTAFYEGARGLWRPVFGEGGLWVDGSLQTASGKLDIKSDDQWRCVQSDAWRQDVPRINHGLGFIECLDANKLPANWQQADFNDGDWDCARELLSGGGGPEAFFGGLINRPFPTLLPRGIPHFVYENVQANRIVWAKTQTSHTALPIEQRLYEEELSPLKPGMITNVEALLSPAGAPAQFTTQGDEHIGLLLDFGRIIIGRPHIAFEAKGGEIIEIACSEHLPDEWAEGGPHPDARLTRRPMLGLDAHICRYIAKPCQQVFERFEWCAIRWMHVVIRHADAGLSVTRLGATTENYPVEARGNFRCSDQLLNQLWQVGAYTLRQCMHDAWIDCPSREQRQWLGDATVESLVGWAAFGPSVTPLNAKFLVQAAESQRPDGLTQMYAPGDHHTDGLLIPDWTLQWILNAANHYAQTGDIETIEAIMPAIQKALAWFVRQSDETGLVVDMPYWHFMDWAGVGRAGYASALNGQLMGTYVAAADLCEALGMIPAAANYRSRAKYMEANLQKLHWDDRRGVFVDCVDPTTKAQDLRVSQHANAAMALWGHVPHDQVQKALARIVEPTRLTFTAAPPIANTGETLDGEEGVVLANTFYSHFVYEALAKHGRIIDALELMRQRFGPMLARGATTLWESFEPTASLCHAFSASPTWQMSRHVLGVHPLQPGYAYIGVSPNIAGLKEASGTFPTPQGDVHVNLSKTEIGFDAEITTPIGTPVEIIAALGYRLANGPIVLPQGGKATARFVIED